MTLQDSVIIIPCTMFLTFMLLRYPQRVALAALIGAGLAIFWYAVTAADRFTSTLLMLALCAGIAACVFVWQRVTAR
jgi:hypothetical protein